MGGAADETALELRKVKLEERRYTADIVKWAIAAVGAIVSFYVIDIGKLRLEEFKSHAENQRLLLQAYLTATEAVQPDVWERKLRVINTYADDDRVRNWAARELKDLKDYAAREALYRETLKIASQLVYKPESKDPAREKARARFEQLYWAELPYVSESSEVEKAMVRFRDALLDVEAKRADRSQLEQALLKLSHVLSQSQQATSK